MSVKPPPEVKQSSRAAQPLRYIVRLDTRHHGWRVAFQRAKVYVHKYFTDAAYGGKAAALAAAVAWRDEQVAMASGPDYEVWKRQLKKPRVRPGPTGVSRAVGIRKRDGTEYRRWEAYWTDLDGKCWTRSFGVSTYGERRAKAMAIAAREEGMAKLARDAELAAREQSDQ